MKRLFVLLTIFMGIFGVTGCTKSEEEKVIRKGNFGEIIGDVVEAKFDRNGRILIEEDDITDTVTFINYEYEGVIIGLIAVKDSNGEVKVVVNTCQSCGGSPYAYFIQVGSKLQCQNCGNYFAIDELDNLIDDGCNPIPIEDITREDGIITIGIEQLQNLKDKFENWEGPKE